MPLQRVSLRTRMRVYASAGLAVVLAWLYYAIASVSGLSDLTVKAVRNAELRHRAIDAGLGLDEALNGLERYSAGGQGYDLSRYQAGRNSLKTAVGAMRRYPLAESTRGRLYAMEAAEDAFVEAAKQVTADWAPENPALARAAYDTAAAPAAARLRGLLAETEQIFARAEAIAEEQLTGSRERVLTALVILAALIVVGLFWLLADVNRRILMPCASAADAMADLAAGRLPPQLFDQSNDEIGALGRHFNRTAALFEERARLLEERDIEASVNSLLAAAAEVNDLAGFGPKVMEKILAVSGASAALLYLPEPDGSFAPAVAVGGAKPQDTPVGREEAQRAALERKPVFLSVDARTPTVNLFDGRILPRESVHIPLVHFDNVVGVLALGATSGFTPKAQNALTAIAPLLAVALANASANERVANQSRRLTEQNELLEEQRNRIERTARELQRASALKDRFLASVSHELRTPMTVILGFTGALLRGSQGDLNPRQKESLERVQRNAKLLLGLINDVLDISKIEAGKMEIARQEVSIPDLLKLVQSDYAEAAKRKGLELTAEAAPDFERVMSDQAKLLQILANLVGNALKFTERGSILVRAEPRAAGRWALIVADTGIGIPEEDQGPIFEEFRQSEAEEHRGRGGTGLGLAIVRKLALALGGNISLESERGKGSRFTVLLPRDLPSEAAAEAPTRIPAPIPSLDGDRRKVLIVDDEESIRRLLMLELESQGVAVLEASDGVSGIEIARFEKPDAILLDVLMPRMDGWETLRTLKQLPETRSIPVVLLSVVDNRAYGLSLGAFDYLTKPVERRVLLQTLARAGVLATRGHLLFADDDADVRRLFEQELVAAGYRVRTAGGGAEALELLEKELPSALLLDLIMPPPDGFEVLYRIRQNPAWDGLPIIIFTAKDLTSEDYRRLNGSVVRIIQKGADPSRLVPEVLAAIRSGKKEQT